MKNVFWTDFFRTWGKKLAACKKPYPMTVSRSEKKTKLTKQHKRFEKGYCFQEVVQDFFSVCDLLFEHRGRQLNTINTQKLCLILGIYA